MKMRVQHKQIAFPLRSLGISDAARRRLPLGVAAQIVSTFRRGIAVVPGDDLRGRPIFISPPGEGLLPEHVIVPRKSFMKVMETCRAGDFVAVEHGRHFALEMPRLPADAATLRAGLQILQARVASKRPTGLDIPSSEILAPEWEWSEIFGCDWSRKAPGESRERRHLLLRRLVGRGHGSTPAGDDMLVGALAFLCAWKDAPRTQTFFETLRAMEPKFPVLTTRTSEVYLHWALRSVFSSDIIRLTSALMTGDTARMQRGVDGLLSHGDTSGLDTLVGIILMVRGGGFGCAAAS